MSLIHHGGVMIHAESQAASKYYNGRNRMIVLEASSDVYAERGGEMRRLSPRIQHKEGWTAPYYGTYKGQRTV